MSRANLKINQETKDMLDDVKQDGETWDDCLQRLVQLERATRIQDN
jgi:cell division protein FtsL